MGKRGKERERGKGREEGGERDRCGPQIQLLDPPVPVRHRERGGISTSVEVLTAVVGRHGRQAAAAASDWGGGVTRLSRLANRWTMSASFTALARVVVEVVVVSSSSNSLSSSSSSIQRRCRRCTSSSLAAAAPAVDTTLSGPTIHSAHPIIRRPSLHQCFR